MSRLLPFVKRVRPLPRAAGSAAPADWMATPEKRREIWAWMGLAAAFVGDEERAKLYFNYAAREDAKCAEPRLRNGACPASVPGGDTQAAAAGSALAEAGSGT